MNPSRAGLLALVLAACGDAQLVSSPSSELDDTSQELATPSDQSAARFLGQATFGPTDDEIAKVKSMGYAAWLQEQMTLGGGASHLAYVRQVAPPVVNPPQTDGPAPLWHSIWTQSATRQDQVRQRLAYAWSQIMVVSTYNGANRRRPAGMAAYFDVFAKNAFGSYRQLLEEVSLHPMMGLYLSHLKNQKANPRTGRAPDENYAREVMQLFTIGLFKLNADGTPMVGANGKPIETYDYDDVQGLAKVFTGWSWACASGADPEDCFLGRDGAVQVERDIRLMQANDTYHSPEEKKFLGLTIPENTKARPTLELALDHLAGHANVGPFIGRQLIQRLVTSNPSPEYVRRVTRAFNQGTATFNGITFGSAVRGDLAAVTAAVLLDPEARADVELPTSMKLREPVLRVTNWMRAFTARPAQGATDGIFRLPDLTSPGDRIGQNPMTSTSVFNFYRPGYVPGNTAIARQGLVAPEFQITDEVSVAGYANWLLETVDVGIPMVRKEGETKAFRLVPNYTKELALADNVPELVDRVGLLLAAKRLTADTRAKIETAVSSVAIPASPASAIADAKARRVRIAVYLTLISADSQVQ